MYPLFETVCIRDAKVMYPEWHIRRYEESFLRFYGYPPQEPLFDSVSLLDSLQRLPASDTVKMKILYGSKGKTVELSPYSSKNIQTLKMVEADDIDYSLKFADRSCLDALLSLDVVWNAVDIAMAIMTLTNLVALLWLFRWGVGALRDYEAQRADGLAEPVFRGRGNPHLPADVPGDVWA